MDKASFSVVSPPLKTIEDVAWIDFTFTSFMDVGDAMSTTSIKVVKVGLENKVGLELELILGWSIRKFSEKNSLEREKFSTVGLK